MLDVPRSTLQARAARLAAAGIGEVVEAWARVGGGALPLLELHGPVLALGASDAEARALAHALRAANPPLVPRLAGGRVLIDPRTLADDELDAAAAAIAGAIAAIGYPGS